MAIPVEDLDTAALQELESEYYREAIKGNIDFGGGGGGTLPAGGPYVIANQSYELTSSSGILVNNFDSINYGLIPFETNANFYLSPVSVLGLTTDPLPDGVYTVTVAFCYGTSSTNTSFVGALWMDGVQVDLKEFRAEIKDTDDSVYTSFEAPITIEDGLVQPHTFELKMGIDSFSFFRVARLWYANIRVQSEV